MSELGLEVLAELRKRFEGVREDSVINAPMAQMLVRVIAVAEEAERLRAVVHEGDEMLWINLQRTEAQRDALAKALREADGLLAGMWSYDEAGRTIQANTWPVQASEVIRAALAALTALAALEMK